MPSPVDSMLALNAATSASSKDEGTGVCPLCRATLIADFLAAPDRFHGRQDRYHLRRCASCTCVWLAQPPTLGEMPLHYDEDYHRTITIAGETATEDRWRRHRDLIVKVKQRGSILDIGCSSGSFLSTLKADGWNLFGIEMEPATAAKASATTGATVFVGDVLDAPFLDEQFDVITCFDVLEHLYEPQKLLMKARAWLKPGGIFYVVLPNIQSWEARLLGGYWYGLELPRHLFHFSPTSLRYIASRLGLSEIRLNTRNSYLERSVGYLYFELLKRFTASSPVPPCRPRTVSFTWRMIRRLLRLTIVRPFAGLASVAGAGASIEAMFLKDSRYSASSRGPVIQADREAAEPTHAAG